MFFVYNFNKMNQILKKMKNERFASIILAFLFVLNAIIFWCKQGSFIIDTGREFYIPYQMLKGEILYKDIFNIYGPLSYQINSVAYLLFGQNITSLLIFGLFNSFVILLSIYFIAREFLSEHLSILIGIFVIYSTIFMPDLFNSNMPYAYAISYALSGLLVSVFFLIKYVKNQKPLYIYLACFFAGFSLANKYEYVFYPILVLYILLFSSKPDLKKIVNSLLCFFIIPVISYGVLFLQGLTLADFCNNLSAIVNLSKTYTLKYFYTNSVGFYFNYKIFIFLLLKFFTLIIMFLLLYSGVLIERKISQKAFGYLFRFVYVFIFIFAIFLVDIYPLGLLAVINLILLAAFFKKIFVDKPLFVLMLCSITASLKTFWGMNAYLYGVFVIPLLLVSTVVIFFKISSWFTKNEDIIFNIKKALYITVLAFTVSFMLRDYYAISQKNELIETSRGRVYSYPFIAKPNRELIDYIDTNTKKTDKVVILPETPFANFLTDRDSDNYYSSLIPLYFETFTEKKIIEHFKNTRPEYIVLNNRDTSDYGLQYICKDYALGFCEFVYKNYKADALFGDEYKILVFKRKDIK